MIIHFRLLHNRLFLIYIWNILLFINFIGAIFILLILTNGIDWLTPVYITKPLILIIISLHLSLLLYERIRFLYID